MKWKRKTYITQLQSNIGTDKRNLVYRFIPIDTVLIFIVICFNVKVSVIKLRQEFDER